MKKIFFGFYKTSLLAVILAAGPAQGQVGPGTASPHKSASLDLTSVIKNGLLLPRVKLLSLTDSATIATGHPAKGLLLYNIGVALPDSVGFYYWAGTGWLKMSGDNLGNHKATQGLAMNDNALSNDGNAAKGLIVDNTGNVTFRQQLSLKGFGAGLSGDNMVSVSPAGLVEKTVTAGGSFVVADNFSRKFSASANIASGDSADVTATSVRTPTYMVVVTTGNACGRGGVGVFMISNNTVSFMGGQARNAKYTVTAVPGYNGSRLKIDASMVSCVDGGGTNQFGFTVMALPGNVIRVINSGSLIYQTYAITVTET